MYEEIDRPGIVNNFATRIASYQQFFQSHGAHHFLAHLQDICATAMPKTEPSPKGVVARKRNRKRKRRVASSSSSSSSSSSDSSDGKVVPAVKRPIAAEATASDSSSSSSSSSESDSDLDDRVKTPYIPHLPTQGQASQRQDVSPLKQHPGRSSSSSPPPASIPSFLPSKASATEADQQNEQSLKDRFRKFWMASVADGFKDDLEQIRKEPGLTTSRLAMLIDSLASGADIFTSSATAGKSNVNEMEVVLDC